MVRSGRRESVLVWMKGRNPLLMERAERDLEELFQMDPTLRLKAYRDLYDMLLFEFPNRVWMTDDGKIHESEPKIPQEECTWCINEPDEEAHLCPKCSGTGIVRDLPLLLDPLKLFLVDPVRNSLL